MILARAYALFAASFCHARSKQHVPRPADYCVLLRTTRTAHLCILPTTKYYRHYRALLHNTRRYYILLDTWHCHPEPVMRQMTIEWEDGAILSRLAAGGDLRILSPDEASRQISRHDVARQGLRRRRREEGRRARRQGARRPFAETAPRGARISTATQWGAQVRASFSWAGRRCPVCGLMVS